MSALAAQADVDALQAVALAPPTVVAPDADSDSTEAQNPIQRMLQLAIATEQESIAAVRDLEAAVTGLSELMAKLMNVVSERMEQRHQEEREAQLQVSSEADSEQEVAAASDVSAKL